ncbi:hypothetical protein WAK64_03315 [Bacillus spongiae]|uniref:Spore coat protein n=1 Tax=Bacillus spongiae TaxID=2683610 RepID=A0ABU8H9U9_9BACI
MIHDQLRRELEENLVELMQATSDNKFVQRLIEEEQKDIMNVLRTWIHTSQFHEEMIQYYPFEEKQWEQFGRKALVETPQFDNVFQKR